MKERILHIVEGLPEPVRNVLLPALMRRWGYEYANVEEEEEDWLPESFSPDQVTNPLQAAIVAAFKTGETQIGGLVENKEKEE